MTMTRFRRWFRGLTSPARHIFLTIIFGLTSIVHANDRPNIVIIYADDLGWGDLGCYGHPTSRTPSLDRMAAEGMRFTSFYSAAEVCTPSRAALLTGRYPLRSGMCHNLRRVLFTDSAGGIQPNETTLAEALHDQGYATACIGKWHLGHLPEFLPTRHGFDSYFGIPYSNDMDRVADRKLGREVFFEPKIEYWNPPLMRGEAIIERPADQHTLTKRYTEHAVEFIQAQQGRPFFLYLAHAMVHVPLFASDRFSGKSQRGRFGDALEELDWSVGEILKSLRDLGLDKSTLVIFSSDNGPWLTFDQHGGSAGPLRDGKGSTWEGGMRVPGIFWWPGRIPAAAVTHEMACTMDVFTTAIRLGNAKLPTDVPIDGLDLRALLFGEGVGLRDSFFYYRGTDLYAARKGLFKAHFVTRSGYGPDDAMKHEPPLLFHLGNDPGERFDVAGKHPQIIEEIRSIVAEHQRNMVAGENQLAKIAPKRN